MGFHETHIWKSTIGRLPFVGVTARQVLAANLNRLMADSEGLKTIQQLHKASGVSKSTIDRCRRAEVNLGLDYLTDLARPFGLLPWQLLQADVDIPLPMPSQEAMKVAFFWDKMTPAERRRLDHMMAAALDVDLSELAQRERNFDTGLGSDDIAPEEPTGTK